MDGRSLAEVQDFADGLLTSRGTFQKFFDQQELRNWIDQSLQTTAVPAAPGVFYVFRDEEKRASFVASRFRRHLVSPHIPRSVALYSENEELLRPLVDFVSDQGRLPADNELSNTINIRSVFGSLRRAFQVIARVTETADWEKIARQRKEDMLIYLALARFDRRPTFGQLPRVLQQDVKVFFKTYQQACSQADDIELAKQYGRYGYRRITALLQHAGWRVGKDRASASDAAKD